MLLGVSQQEDAFQRSGTAENNIVGKPVDFRTHAWRAGQIGQYSWPRFALSAVDNARAGR